MNSVKTVNTMSTLETRMATQSADERPIKTPFLEAEDRAIRHIRPKNAAVTGLDEIRDRALLEQPGIEPRGTGRLEKIPWRDENQLAARIEMAHAFLDEMQIKVGVAVEQLRAQVAAGLGQDVTGLHVRRIADDGVETLRLRVSEKVAGDGAGRRMRRIQLNAHRARQVRQKPAVATGRLQNPASFKAKAVEGRIHGSHDHRRREVRIERGLLARADQNLLYVDEVNLLEDTIVDAILDASAAGSYTVRRGVMAGTYRSRFVMIGSMNPEEGKLRPQLLDRFGLRVNVRGLMDAEERLEIYNRVRAYRTNPHGFMREWASATVAAREAEIVERAVVELEQAAALGAVAQPAGHVGDEAREAEAGGRVAVNELRVHRIGSVMGWHDGRCAFGLDQSNE